MKISNLASFLRCSFYRNSDWRGAYAQNAPRDELGVKVVNILYNLEVGSIYCILDAPNQEAVEKHHEKIGVKCDMIMEVKTTQKTWEAPPEYYKDNNSIGSAPLGQAYESSLLKYNDPSFPILALNSLSSNALNFNTDIEVLLDGKWTTWQCVILWNDRIFF